MPRFINYYEVSSFRKEGGGVKGRATKIQGLFLKLEKNVATKLEGGEM